MSMHWSAIGGAGRFSARRQARLRARGSRPAGKAPVSTATSSRGRVSAVMREGERVTPLELFFDLVFVLALTQCTSLMAAPATWGNLLKGLLALGVLWWSWVGYG